MATATRQATFRRLRRVSRPVWYAPNARLRSRSAVQNAIEIADWIRSQNRTGPKPDEQSLFIALHTCAFRAARSDSAREQRRWLRRWSCIREYIVAENLGLAYSMIGRFRAKELDHDDLLSEAMFALARAVDRFNPWRGFRFSTYACNVIARALMRRGKAEARYRRFFPVQTEGPFDQVQRPDTDVGIYVERLRRAMDRNLGDLTEMESRILESRFPVGQTLPQTFRQIGKLVGLSKERVRQIQNVALHKLRDALRADPLLS